MDEKKYKITLADGTVIDHLELNGDNFISKVSVEPEIFYGNCSRIIISDGLHDEVHTNMELVQITPMGGEYWFVLRELTTTEVAFSKMQSDIDFLAMMSNVEL